MTLKEMFDSVAKMAVADAMAEVEKKADEAPAEKAAEPKAKITKPLYYNQTSTAYKKLTQADRVIVDMVSRVSFLIETFLRNKSMQNNMVTMMFSVPSMKVPAFQYTCLHDTDKINLVKFLLDDDTETYNRMISIVKRCIIGRLPMKDDMVWLNKIYKDEQNYPSF